MNMKSFDEIFYILALITNFTIIGIYLYFYCTNPCILLNLILIFLLIISRHIIS